MSKHHSRVDAFWSETDVWLFSPLARIKKLSSMLAGLLLIVIGLYVFGKAMPEWPAAILSISTTIALGLFGLCCEMYYKGGKTASKIQSELDAKNAWRRAAKDDVIPIFHELANRSFILSHSEVNNWFDEAVVRIRECLAESYAEQLVMELQQKINADYGHRDPNDHSRAAHRTHVL